MLVISRKKNESLAIAGNITVRVVSVKGQVVRLGITAPREIPVYRTDPHKQPATK